MTNMEFGEGVAPQIPATANAAGAPGIEEWANGTESDFPATDLTPEDLAAATQELLGYFEHFGGILVQTMVDGDRDFFENYDGFDDSEKLENTATNPGDDPR